MRREGGKEGSSNFDHPVPQPKLKSRGGKKKSKKEKSGGRGRCRRHTNGLKRF